MKINFSSKNHSVRYNLIISYIFILLVAVVTETFIYFFNTSVVENEINSSNKLVIDKIKNNVDGILSDVDNFSMAALSNQKIQTALSINNISNGESYFRLYEANKELYNYRIFNKYVKNFFIYFNDLNTVVGPGAVNRQEDYYNFYFAANGFTLQQWVSMMKSKYNGDYIIIPMHDEVTGDKEVVGYIRSITYQILNGPYANLVILLDFDELVNSNVGKSDSFNERNILILDKNDNVITGDKYFSKSGLDYNRLRGEQGTINQIIDGKKVVVSYTSSKINEWKYITVTPESVFWKELRYTRNIMLGSLAFCIVFGAGISYFFMRRNYNPLKEVVSFFQSKVTVESDIKNNEYGFLQNALNETLRQKDTLNMKLEQQNNTLRSKFMSDLLKGRNMAVPVNELMNAYNIAFKYDNFTVMVIYIECMAEDFWDEYDDPTVKYKMCKFVISNVLEELINANNYGFMTDVDDMFVCLINTEVSGESYKNEVKAIINTAKDFLLKNYKITLAFSIGGLHKTLKGIPEAYREAVNAMEYLNIMGLDGTAFYDEIPQMGEMQYYYPVEKEYQLINLIKAADYNGAVLIFEEIFTRNFINIKPTLDIARCITFDIISTLLKTANEIEKLDDKIFMEKISPVNNLIKFKNYMEMKDEIFKILKDICNYISTNMDNNDCKIKDRVINIIDCSFDDPNLSIATISDQIGRFPYYISRIFKEQTGEGIMEYINRVRINKAKGLLKENLWNQEEIAQKVGYTNVRTFYRAFKKQEGITPAKSK